MSATTHERAHLLRFASRAPRYPPDITVYIHENVILGQMSHEISGKHFLSMKVVVGMYAVGGMVGGTHIVDKVRLCLIIMSP